jgi:HK97 family phage major capsid protein/HK97 family phage prohead protease
MNIGRAYSIITVTKAVEEQDSKRRIFSGMATTPTMDRVNDTIDPLGAKFATPLPLLRAHDSRQPIGNVTFKKPTAKGIEFEAEIPVIDPAKSAELAARLDMAWEEIRSGIVKAVSIGFRALKYSFLDNGGIAFEEIEVYELSTVAVPANSEAVITSVKSIDKKLREAAGVPESTLPDDITSQAAPGKKRFAVVKLTPPAPGNSQHDKMTPLEGNQVKISEKISRFESKRAANMAAIAAIHEGTDESLNEQQVEEVKNLEAEVATIDRELPSLKRLEADMAKTAKAVKPNVNDDDDTTSARVTVKNVPKPEPGIRMARFVRCLGLAHKEKVDIMRVAKALYGERDPEIVGFIQKAAGTAIGALNTTTDSALIGNEGIIGDFVEFLRAQTIIGKFGAGGIPSLRSIPFRVPLVSQSSGGTAYWVGEGDGKPLTKPGFARTELAPLKVAAITVATMELLRDSSPAAERMLRDDLAAAVAARLDVTFVSPSVAAVNGVSPASITNGAEVITSAATTDADAIRNEVRSVMLKFVNALNPLTSGVWIMGSSTALALSMMVNTLGQSEFPGININGGTFMGLPVLVSDHVTDYVVLVNASDIWFGDEGGLQIDMSDQASLQMVAGDDEGSTQSSVTPTATSVVSMFQTNSVAFRAERTMNWARRRTSAVAYIEDVDWGGTVLT